VPLQGKRLGKVSRIFWAREAEGDTEGYRKGRNEKNQRTSYALTVGGFGVNEGLGGWHSTKKHFPLREGSLRGR